MTDPLNAFATILWFKRDLRIRDHPALTAAGRGSGPLIPLYIVEPEMWAHPDASARQWRFVVESVGELRRDLAALGAPLIVRHGEAVAVLRAIHDERPVARLVSHEETGLRWSWDRDRRVREWCRINGIAWEEHVDSGVVRRLASRDGWAARRERFVRQPVAETPESLRATNLAPGDVPDARALGLAFDPCPERQTGGRAAAELCLHGFLHERGETYQRDMSSPVTGESGCSRLSPHLAWGTLSVREVHRAAVARIGETRDDGTGWAKSLTSFKSRLAWRDHFTQKLEDFPDLDRRCIHSGFEGMRPRLGENDAGSRLSAWAEGRTGLPFVDACMRHAAATGWLNFRMRAMVQAVASYHLWLDWRDSGPVLARLWTDYAPGIHWAQSQMQSGVTGINALRIYNPVKQGRDQDPTGAFTRRWVPELKGLDAEATHEPWRLPDPPKGYPPPIVDVAGAARAARATVAAYRRRPGFREEADAVAAKHGSRKPRLPQRRARRKPDARQTAMDV